MSWQFSKDLVSPKDTGFYNFEKELIQQYTTKYEIARDFKPKRILEIGVRAGYSAYSFLQAVPDAYYLGIDLDHGTNGGEGGPWITWAKHLLKDYNAEFLIVDSQQITDIHFKPFDLIHIDGDHHYLAERRDIEMTWRCLAPTGIMLVDDYDSIPDVRIAVDEFVRKNNLKTEHRYSFRGELIIHA